MVAAQPCVHLHAPPATHVRVAGHAVRVCGRGVVIRGADKASAAGNRIATVHARRRDVVIRLYRVGRRVTRLRTFVRRVRAGDGAVLLTRTELAAGPPQAGAFAVTGRGIRRGSTVTGSCGSRTTTRPSSTAARSQELHAEGDAVCGSTTACGAQRFQSGDSPFVRRFVLPPVYGAVTT